jgi:hypothetical protein
VYAWEDLIIKRNNLIFNWSLHQNKSSVNWESYWMNENTLKTISRDCDLNRGILPNIPRQWTNQIAPS